MKANKTVPIPNMVRSLRKYRHTVVLFINYELYFITPSTSNRFQGQHQKLTIIRSPSLHKQKFQSR